MQTSAFIVAYIRDGSVAALRPCKWCSMSAALNFVILVMDYAFYNFIYLFIYLFFYFNISKFMFLYS